MTLRMWSVKYEPGFKLGKISKENQEKSAKLQMGKKFQKRKSFQLSFEIFW